MESDASPVPDLPGELIGPAGMLPQLQQPGHLKRDEEEAIREKLHGQGLESASSCLGCPRAHD